MLTSSTINFYHVDIVNISANLRRLSMTLASSFRKFLAELWSASAPLITVTFLMLLGLVGAGIAMTIDHRVITGVPAWIKPTKFAISTAIYSASVAWLLRYVTVWHRFVRVMSRLLAAALVIEVGIIFLQAARGTTSHFNTATPLDAALFNIMGSFIGLLWFSSVGILAALFRQKFDRPAWAWALRLGMLVTVLGAATGGMMLRTTPEQVRLAQERHVVTANGGHTVGAPDGGPGLPVLAWSTEHGDLRIPHFLGLHALQIVPFLTWLLIRRHWPEQKQVQAVMAISLSYASLIAILAWQAMRGQSIIAPDALTVTLLLIWISGTLATLATIGRLRTLAYA
jgi:hypothetical protein